ncbi:MAG: phosphate/phosphite/phosphonate ABC transporter substrate-binding protein [Pseudonocardiaceae bacterium]
MRTPRVVRLVRGGTAIHRARQALVAIAVLAAGCVACGSAPSGQPNAAGCPNGTVRMGVQPFLAAPKLTPAYQELGDAISRGLGCPVTVSVTTDYAAETEAMAHDQLEFAEFPPFGFVLAEKRANLVPIATFGTNQGKISSAVGGIAVRADSPFHTLADLRGHSVAFSAPTATSGHLLPAYGLALAGVDPATDIKPVYLGTHSATFTALSTGKVDAAELNSVQIAAATAAGQYHPGQFRMLWQSAPSPSDPIVVRGDLPAAFRQHLRDVLLNIRLDQLSPSAAALFNKTLSAQRFVAAGDPDYDSVRKIAATPHLTSASVG